jgi:hypothetical protein
LNSYFPSSTEGWFITWTLFELRRWLTDVTALSELARWFEEVEMSSFFDDRATLAMGAAFDEACRSLGRFARGNAAIMLVS